MRLSSHCISHRRTSAPRATDEKTFIDIFAGRSFPQLAATADAYAKLSDNDLIKVVDKETSFNFRKALKMILSAARNLHETHAELLKQASRLRPI